MRELNIFVQIILVISAALNFIFDKDIKAIYLLLFALYINIYNR